jgi:hypothetical protein
VSGRPSRPRRFRRDSFRRVEGFPGGLPDALKLLAHVRAQLLDLIAGKRHHVKCMRQLLDLVAGTRHHVKCMRVLRCAPGPVLEVLDPYQGRRQSVEVDHLACDPLGVVGDAHAPVGGQLGADHHGLVPGSTALYAQVGPVDPDAAVGSQGTVRALR